MAFQFSLAAVLRVRESLETREERALQAIQLDAARTAHQVEELSEAIAGAQRARELELQQSISGGRLQSLLWEEQTAEQRLTLLAGRLQLLEQAREEQLKVYQAAHQDRELLTDMRRKQREIYDREWLREEQKRLDDIFMARRHRVS
jgi:flagellar biosynthesis chaperone FliJ